LIGQLITFIADCDSFDCGKSITLLEKKLFDWYQKYRPSVDDKNKERFFEEDFKKIRDHYQKTIIRRVQSVAKFVELKSLLKQSIMIGVVGVHNAGKSTLIEKMWNIESKSSGAFEHTLAIEPHPIGGNSNIMVLDYPGSTDINNNAAEFIGRLAVAVRCFVVVFKIGHIGEAHRFKNWRFSKLARCC